MWIELVRSRVFSFTNLQASANQELLLSEALASADWQSATLVVRIEAATIGTGGTVTVQAYAEWPDDSERSRVYVDGTALGTITLSSSTVSPDLERVSLLTSAVAGAPALRVTVKGTQPGTAGNLEVTLSVGLVVHGR